MNAWLVSGEAAWQLAGWTMLHFLWVGALAALAGGGVRACCRQGRPGLRYGVSLLSFVLLAAAPLGIAIWLAQQGFPVAASDGALQPRALPGGSLASGLSISPPRGISGQSEGMAPRVIDLAQTPVVVAQTPGTSADRWDGDRVASLASGEVENGVSPSPHPSLPGRGIAEAVASWLPWIWLAGAPVTFVLLATGLVGSRRLKRRCVAIADGVAAETFRRACALMKVTRRVALAACDGVAQPVLVGIVRPTILLPAAALSGWSADELEMVLVHELAHVRRWDNLVNLVQRLVESALFFHPAVWLVSRQVRRDREECCDAAVVTYTQRPEAYAHLLVSIAARRRRTRLAEASLAWASAMADHPLAGRVRRILKLEDEPMRVSRSTLGLAMVLAASLLAAAVALPPTRGASADDASTTPVAPAKSSGEEGALERAADAVADPKPQAAERSKQGGDGDAADEAKESAAKREVKRADYENFTEYGLPKLKSDILRYQSQLLMLQKEHEDVEVLKQKALHNARSQSEEEIVRTELDNDVTFAARKQELVRLDEMIRQRAEEGDKPRDETLRKLQEERQLRMAFLRQYEQGVRNRMSKAPNEALRSALAEYKVRTKSIADRKAELQGKLQRAEARIAEMAAGGGDAPARSEATVTATYFIQRDAVKQMQPFVAQNYKQFGLQSYEWSSDYQTIRVQASEADQKRFGKLLVEKDWDDSPRSMRIQLPDRLRNSDKEAEALAELLKAQGFKATVSTTIIDGEEQKSLVVVLPYGGDWRPVWETTTVGDQLVYSVRLVRRDFQYHDPASTTNAPTVAPVAPQPGSPVADAPRQLELQLPKQMSAAEASRAVEQLKAQGFAVSIKATDGQTLKALTIVPPDGGDWRPVWETRMEGDKPVRVVRMVRRDVQYHDPAAVAPGSPVAVVQPYPGTGARSLQAGRKLQPGDQVHLDVVGAFPDQPLTGDYRIEAEGTLALGAAYGRAPIAGHTVLEAEELIRAVLHKSLTNVRVQLVLKEAAQGNVPIPSSPGNALLLDGAAYPLSPPVSPGPVRSWGPPPLAAAPVLQSNANASTDKTSAWNTAPQAPAVAKQDAKEAEIEEKLRTPVRAEFVEVPLNEAVRILSDTAKVNIYIDPRGINEEGLSNDVPISLVLPNEISVKSALKLVLEPLHLTYVIEDEVVKITSPQRAEKADVSKLFQPKAKARTLNEARLKKLWNSLPSEDAESAQQQPTLPAGMSTEALNDLQSYPQPATRQSSQATRYLYDGKTFDQWRQLWQMELNTTRRREAIEALAAFGRAGFGREAIEAIFDVAGQYNFYVIDNGPEGMLKNRVIELLTTTSFSRLPEAEWLPLIEERLKADPHRYRWLMVHLVSNLQTDNPQVFEKLYELARSEDKPLRIGALKALTRSDAERQDERLLKLADELLTSNDAADVKLGVNLLTYDQPFGEGTVAKARFRSGLLNAAFHPDATVKRVARYGLRCLEKDEAAPVVEQLLSRLDKAKSKDERIAALRALAAIGPKVGGPPMVVVQMIDDKDLDVATAAAVAEDFIINRNDRKPGQAHLIEQIEKFLESASEDVRRDFDHGAYDREMRAILPTNREEQLRLNADSGGGFF